MYCYSHQYLGQTWYGIQVSFENTLGETMLTEAIEVMKYIKASAGRSSLHVVFEDKNMPRHDGNTIYLPKVTVKTTESELTQMMASVDHEVAHDLYSDFQAALG